MRSTRWKMLKWPFLAVLSVFVLVICSGWTHGVHQVIGPEAGFGHDGGSFRSGNQVFVQRIGVEHDRGGFALIGLLTKIGVLLIGAVLFAKGKSVLKWIGGLMAAVALWSLLSFWTIVIAAVVIGAYIYIRKRSKGGSDIEMTPSPEWLAEPVPHNDVHILDQWERQLTKEAKQ
ncbi:hypothetical protein DFQ01_11758 [Paenibacillus cellulosilyticus]|uniref:Uncharacterized protein n=1 Tax=Paenibacillus cellulosilyticus TaxID=375489 RepID=A0A2V2YQJ0_9BACL|nr:hypothetical protein [Paenibacillus cellulosilyticus]PWV98548.1 hypothetical protein DFQ01_11758 [Paenibacillus cellulosilyticus]QKS44154.1 hypothetical protein HUB94_06690 [Paenibacillus cellulosilyticus]